MATTEEHHLPLLTRGIFRTPTAKRCFSPRTFPPSCSQSDLLQVKSLFGAKTMTAQGDLPQRPTHPHVSQVERAHRSGEFDRTAQNHPPAHRSSSSDHNFASTYPANAALTSMPAPANHHTRRPSFDSGRSREDQVLTQPECPVFNISFSAAVCIRPRAGQ